MSRFAAYVVQSGFRLGKKCTLLLCSLGFLLDGCPRAEECTISHDPPIIAVVPEGGEIMRSPAEWNDPGTSHLWPHGVVRWTNPHDSFSNLETVLKCLIETGTRIEPGQEFIPGSGIRLPEKINGWGYNGIRVESIDVDGWSSIEGPNPDESGRNFLFGRPRIKVNVVLADIAVYLTDIWHERFPSSHWVVSFGLAGDADMWHCSLDRISLSGHWNCPDPLDWCDPLGIMNTIREALQSTVLHEINGALDYQVMLPNHEIGTIEQALCSAMFDKFGLFGDPNARMTVVGVDGDPETHAAYFVVDLDQDGDSIGDSGDNCPLVANRSQLDYNGDGVGDACESALFLPILGKYFINSYTMATDIETGETRFFGGNDRAVINMHPRGGYGAPGNLVEARGEARYCTCNNIGSTPIGENECEEYWCNQEGIEWTDVSRHGWYPISWSRGRYSRYVSCDTSEVEPRDGVFCPPFGAMTFRPADTWSNDWSEIVTNTWHWRNEALPPDGVYAVDAASDVRQWFYLWTRPVAMDGSPFLQEDLFENRYSELFSGGFRKTLWPPYDPELPEILHDYLGWLKIQENDLRPGQIVHFYPFLVDGDLLFEPVSSGFDFDTGSPIDETPIVCPECEGILVAPSGLAGAMAPLMEGTGLVLFGGRLLDGTLSGEILAGSPRSPEGMSNIPTIAAVSRMEVHDVETPVGQMVRPSVDNVRPFKAIYASSPDGSQVVALDTQSMAVVRSISTPEGTGVLATRPETEELWVGEEGAVSVVDTSIDALTRSIDVGEGLVSDIAFDPATGRGLVLVARSVIPGGEGCEEPLAQVEYDGCSLPDDPNQINPWTLNPGSAKGAYVESCELVLPADTLQSVIGYSRAEPMLAVAGSYFIEARLRIEDFLVHSEFTPLASFAVGDGTVRASLFFTEATPGGHQIATWYKGSILFIPMDWSEYHVYRIEVIVGDRARFLVDGEVVLEQDYYGFESDPEGPGFTYFAGAESVSRWDELSYEICGTSPMTQGTCAVGIEPDSTEVALGECLMGTACQIELPQVQDQDALVVCREPGMIATLDTASLTFANRTPLGFEPSGSLILPIRNELLISDDAEGVVHVFNIGNLAAIATIDGVPGAGVMVSAALSKTALVAGMLPDGSPSVYQVDLEQRVVVKAIPTSHEVSSMIARPDKEGFLAGLQGSSSLGFIRDLGVTPAAAPPMAGMAMAFDRSRSEMLVFGGETESGYTNDLWVLEWPEMAWRKETIVSASKTAANQSKDAETWPTARAAFASELSTGQQTLFLYGGIGPGGLLSDIWALDLPNRSFELLHDGSGVAPMPRKQPALAYLAARNALFMFGGRTELGNTNDTWLFDLNAKIWTPFDLDCSERTCPPALRNPIAIPSPDGQRVFLMGGASDEGLATGDGWSIEIASGQWVRQETTSELSAAEGGLVRVQYMGRIFGLKIAESFDSTPLLGSWARDTGLPTSDRWHGEVFIPKDGEYVFRIRASGGARLFLDEGKIGIAGGRHRDSNFGSCNTLDTTTEAVDLRAGWHKIAFDLTECRKNVSMEVSIESGPEGCGALTPESFRVRSAPALNRRCNLALGALRWPLGEDLDHDPIAASWPEGLPESLCSGLLPDWMKEIEWQGKLEVIQAGEYRFDVVSDVPVTLEVDDRLLLRSMPEPGGHMTSDAIQLDASWHIIRLHASGGRRPMSIQLRFSESCPVMGGSVVPAALFAADVPER